MPTSKRNVALLSVAVVLLVAAGAVFVVWEIFAAPPNVSINVISATSKPTLVIAAMDPMRPFYQLYALQPDQPVKRVPPPFISQRVNFFRGRRPEEASENPQGPTAMFVFIRNAQPTLWVYRFSGNYGALGICRNTLGIFYQDIEGDRTLAPSIPGDFVFNMLASKEQMLAADEKIIHDATGIAIKLRFRQVERPVIVFRGNWKPALGGDHIEIYGMTKDSGNANGIRGAGASARFAGRLGEWINETVILDAGGVPDTLRWRVNQSGDGTAASNDHLHDRELVCGHISEQTGLT